MSRTKVIHSFDKAAETYDQYAKVQRQCALMLMHMLTRVLPKFNPHSILELGCGTGFMSQLLLQHYPEAHLTLNDIAPAMMEKCKQKFAGRKEIHFYVGNGEYIKLEQPGCDLIVANLCFQWFNDIYAAIARHFQQTELLCFSTLLEGSFKAWDQAYAALDLSSGLHPYPSAASLHQACQNLYPSKLMCFIDEQQVEYASPLDFVRTLRRIGAHQPVAGYQPHSLYPIFRHFNNHPLTINYRIMHIIMVR